MHRSDEITVSGDVKSDEGVDCLWFYTPCLWLHVKNDAVYVHS